MGYRTILGLDLGKFKSVCCVMDAATGAHAFATVQTTPAALHDLLARHAGDDPAQTLLVIETCDTRPAGCTTWPPRWAWPSRSCTRRATNAGGGARSSARPTATTR